MKKLFKNVIICSMIIFNFIFVSACKNDKNDDEDKIEITFESFEIIGEITNNLAF